MVCDSIPKSNDSQCWGTATNVWKDTFLHLSNLQFLYNFHHRCNVNYSIVHPFVFNSLARQYLQFYLPFVPLRLRFYFKYRPNYKKNICGIDRVSPIINDILLVVDLPQKLGSRQERGCCNNVLNSMRRDAVSINLFVSKPKNNLMVKSFLITSC